MVWLATLDLVALSDAERARNYRTRKRGGEVVGLAVVPGESPGPVAAGLEAVLAGFDAPDPLLSAAARYLAASIDRSSVAMPAAVAELRRTVGQLRAAGGQDRPVRSDWLDVMRGVRAERRRKQGWTA